MYQSLAACYAIFFFIGALVVKDPVKNEKNTVTFSNSRVKYLSAPGIELTDFADGINPPSTLNQDIEPEHVMRSSLTWHLIACFILTTVGGMYIVGVFKTAASRYDETFLALVAAIGSCFNAIGRILWGAAADKIPSAEVLFWMSFLFGSFILSYPWALAAGPTYFCLWTMIIHLFEGGNFALYPVIVVDLYGLKYSGKLSSFICGLFSC
jgi:hypothetical protein